MINKRIELNNHLSRLVFIVNDFSRNFHFQIDFLSFFGPSAHVELKKCVTNEIILSPKSIFQSFVVSTATKQNIITAYVILHVVGVGKMKNNPVKYEELPHIRTRN